MGLDGSSRVFKALCDSDCLCPILGLVYARLQGCHTIKPMLKSWDMGLGVMVRGSRDLLEG